MSRLWRVVRIVWVVMLPGLIGGCGSVPSGGVGASAPSTPEGNTSTPQRPTQPSQEDNATGPASSAPTIMLLGEAVVTLHVGERYREAGATAWDREEGNLTGKIRISGEVDTALAGVYYRHYDVADREGLHASVRRIVRVMPDPSRRLYGVTLDTTEHLPQTLRSLRALPRRMMSRVVLDEPDCSGYADALGQLRPVSDILGEVFDSEEIRDYTPEAYLQRARACFDALGDKVAVWEIGNEVNGEWTWDHTSQTPDTVAQKTVALYREAHARGYLTALTLYYNDYAENDGCYALPSEKMREWARTRLPTEVREGIDYLLVSYYEEDCDGHRPTQQEWKEVFDDLGALFPRAQLGFGEVGATRGDKAGYLQRYYTLAVDHPRFAGGYFWWYFAEDMVPKSKPLWQRLDAILRGRLRHYPENTTLQNGELVAEGYELNTSVPRPGYRQSVHESGRFGTVITRVTQAQEGDTRSVVHHYPKDPVWNAEANLTLLQGNRMLVDAQTWQPIHTFSTTSKKRLSRLDPDIRYGIGWLASRHYGVVAEHLLDRTEELICEIPGRYDRITIGEYEGNLDFNDTYMLITAHRDGDEGDIPTLILCNLRTGAIRMKDFNGSNGTRVLHMTSDRVENRLNWATVSPLGRYILVYHYAALKEGKDGSHSTDWYKKVDKYDLNLNFLETVAYKGNHGDVCVSQDKDREFYVQFELEGVGADGRYADNGAKGIWQYDLETKKRTMIAPNHGGGHVSCQNYRRPGWAYITYKSLKQKDRDIFAIMLGDDGVDVHGDRIVNRFAKARFMAEDNSQYGYSYTDRSAHATPSPDGTKVIFKSNWTEGEPLDDFVVERRYTPDP